MPTRSTKVGLVNIVEDHEVLEIGVTSLDVERELLTVHITATAEYLRCHRSTLADVQRRPRILRHRVDFRLEKLDLHKAYRLSSNRLMMNLVPLAMLAP